MVAGGLVIPWLFVLLFTLPLGAVTTGENPYTGIVERNSFGLKPPPDPADAVKPPPPPVSADIKLQGITTILGRKQVLLKIKVPAKPPEPAHEKAVVLDEGLREGEVKVVEINPVTGTVKLDNAGTILSLNLAKDGEKPTPGAASPAAGSPAPGAAPAVLPLARPSLPGVPSPATHAPAGGVTAFGGGSSHNISAFGSNPNSTDGFGNAGQKTIPTRTLRASTPAGGGTAQGGGEYQHLSPEAQAILIEAARPQSGFDPLPKTAITPRDRLNGQPKP